LSNREEFPLLRAWSFEGSRVTRRIWRRFIGDRLYPSDSWKLWRLAPRLLHSHFGYVAVNDLALQSALDVPWVASFYGADVYELGRRIEWREMYARLFDRVTRVLALGPMMAAHLEKLGCPADKVIIHPLGVDVGAVPARPRVLAPRDRLRVLFAGTFREKKGIPYVVDAVALARRRGVSIELHLVGDEAGKPGDAETKNEVFQQIRRLALEDAVTHHSYLPFQNLVELALRSHIFVAPSVTAADGDSEGTPFVLQQMMATAMPTIATLHSDIPYLFGKHTHFLVRERDAEAIADRLQWYAEHPDLLVSDGRLVREQVAREFDARKRAAQLSDLYDTILCPPSSIVLPE
jgi:colanic acid/amylovoran biosynthesis glycosyltransferase